MAAEEEAPRSWQWLRRMLVLLLPTVLGVIYYGLVASDRYVSEAQFVVRTAAKPVSVGSFGALLQMSGLSRANDDAFALQSYMGSRASVQELLEKLPLREIYGREEADLLSRYPSFLYGSTLDQLHRYLAWMISTNFSSTNGITTLRVQAFRPADAKAVADALLALGEQTVNKMNERIREDAIRASQRDVKEFEKRLIDVQVEITHFRNAELLIDPAGSSIMVMELTARLAAELSAVEAQIREVTVTTPNSPTVATLKRRAAALEAQIREERARISDPSGGLAQKLAHYERLILEREFAKSTLSSAMRGLEQARTEARRQHLYLELVVRPNLPDYPGEPARARMIWTIFSLNLIGLLVGWLFYSGISEHSAGQ